MLENQILVVQMLFQHEGCDLNWIHENFKVLCLYQIMIDFKKLVKNELSGRPLDSGSL